MSAGAAASVALCDQVQELFGVSLLNNYGCTETCGAIAISRPGHVYHQHGSVTPLPDWEIQLMDQDGKPVREGEQGEVWVRGPGLMLGYYKETQSPFTTDAWFPTGDTGILTHSEVGKELSLVGRKKELIIRGGENIQPAELEQVLLQSPGVADVVVSGILHALLGETPAAFIVKDPALDLDLSSLIATCREALPDYKVPTGKNNGPFPIYSYRSAADLRLYQHFMRLTLCLELFWASLNDWLYHHTRVSLSPFALDYKPELRSKHWSSPKQLGRVVCKLSLGRPKLTQTGFVNTLTSPSPTSA